MIKQEVEIELEPGLRYTEETGRVSRSLPSRDCFLWKEGYEPLDSTVGRAAKEIGCSYQQAFSPTGWMMGMILDRPGLLRILEPELLRRLSDPTLRDGHDAAFAALVESEIIPDGGMLLRLLTGYWSWLDVLAMGGQVPEAYELMCRAWFPGGYTETVKVPYAHRLDRY